MAKVSELSINPRDFQLDILQFFFSFSKRGSYRHIQTNFNTNVITVILLYEYTNLHMYNVLLFLVKIYPKREGICPKTIPLLERECRVIENHPG